MLANKAKVQILEDKNNNVVIQGLFEQEVTSDRNLLETIEFAFDQRTSHSTTANDTSSRSHAICQILIKTADDKLLGKFIVVDLAGSERAQDTQSNNRQRRLEGAEINKSLLALKECIRAMDGSSGHIPFRASKLTLSIRDSFISKDFNNRVVMVACLCPGTSSSDHSVNTLRYADRLKGKKLLGTQPNGASMSNSSQYNEIPLPQVLEPKKELQPQKPINAPPQFSKDIGSPKPPRQRSREVFPPVQGSDREMPRFGNEGSKNPSILFPKVPEAHKKPIRSSSREAHKNPQIVKQKVASDVNIVTHPAKPFQKKQSDIAHIDKLEEATFEEIKRKTNAKKDFEFLKRTLREESDGSDSNPGSFHKPQVSDEYFHFHEKVGDIIDLHDELMSVHLNIIREDATLLNQESEILKKSQSDQADYEIEDYVMEVENIVKKKLNIYRVN